ncbi:MAG TPA: serine hydrolase [Patescibacteria group bacterium]|nr:serine hydrolase [Patescibacteria group bacterium]
MRKLLTIAVYTAVMLMIGRNLTMLPRFTVFSNPQTKFEDRTNALKAKVVSLIEHSPGNYSVYFSDLTHDTAFGIYEKEMFTGASINKVPIITTLYYLNYRGKIDLDEQITIQKKDIQDYGTGTLRYQKPGGVYSLKTLAKLALKQSDNTAVHVISNRIGTDVIQQTVKQLGLTQTHMENNKISAADLFILFKKIHANEITDNARTQELLGFMQDTDIEDRIPALLPKTVTVSHKTADAVGNMHDAGIIEVEDSVLFLSVLTSDIGGKEEQTRQTIARIAKTIADAYTNE